MKKIYLVLLTLVFALCVVGCNKTKEPASTPTQAEAAKPTIIGAKDVTLTVGEKFKPMNGISAKDAEGNEISSDDISYSGNVDTTKAGTYQATYTVTDKKGTSNSVTITVTVVAKDEEAPLLTGVGNIDVVVTQPFDKMAGVSANDTVDGNVTAQIQVTGDVDYKHLGTYTLTYKVTDKSGNEATKERVVTVSTGAFLFDEDEKVTLAQATASLDPESKYAYGLIKVNYTCEANATVKVKLGDYEVEATHEAAGSYALYVPYATALSEAAITVTGATFDNYIVGDAADVIAPVFTGDFTKTVAISKDHKDSAAQFIIDMCGAKAKDDRDGFITSKVTANLEGVNWDSKEEQTIKLEVLDLAGNKGEQEVKVIVNAETELADFMDTLEAIANDGNVDNAEYSDFYRNATLSMATGDDAGAVKLGELTSGGYWSFGMVRMVLTDLVTSGNYYVLKITARVGLEESQGQLTQGISYRIGGALDKEPWYYEFQGCSVGGSTYGENRMNLTSEYQTIYRIFKADFRDASANAEDCFGIKMEFQLTPQEWVTVYPVYVKEFSISLLSNEDQKPVLKQDTTQPLVYVVGETVDLTKYFTATDIEDENLEIVTEGNVDTTTKGSYPVKFSVTDSAGNKVEQTLTFEVLNAKDETKPVITLTQELQPDYLINEITTEQAIAYLATIIKIEDTKDGATYQIPLTEATVNYGGLDMSAKGEYKVTISAKDSSGNEGKLEFVVVVVKERTTAKYEYDLVADLTPTADGKVGTNTLHTIENVTLEAVNGAIVVTPAEGITANQWPSYCKLKYPGLQGGLEYGKTYVLRLTAKADQARKVQITLVKDWSATLHKNVFNLTDAYQTLEYEFVYTGKNVYNLDMEFHFGQIDYEGSATATNKIYITSLEVYEHFAKVENHDLVADLTPTADGKVGSNTLHTIENVTVEKNEGIIEITPAAGITTNQWSSYCKFKYAGIQGALEEGKSYKIILKAKADVARKVKINLVKDWSSSIGSAVFNLTNEYQEIEFEYVYDSQGAGNVDLEFHFGQVDYEGSATADNKIYIEYFKIIENENKYITYDYTKDLTPTADGKVGEATLHTVENVTVEKVDGVMVVTPVAGLDESSNRYASYSKLKYASVHGFLTDGTTYKIVLVAKADQARKIQAAYVKDWSSTLFKQEFSLTDEYQTFVYEFTYSSAGIYNLDIEFQFGVIDGEASATSTNKVYIKSFDLFELKSYQVKKVGQKYDVLVNGTPYSDGSTVTFTKLDNGSYECSTVKGKYFGWNSFTAPSYAKYFVYTVKSNVESHNISSKVDANGNPYNNKQTNFNVTEEKTYVIDLSTLKADLDPTTLIKFCMWSYADTGAVLTVKEAYFTDVNPLE